MLGLRTWCCDAQHSMGGGAGLVTLLHGFLRRPPDAAGLVPFVSCLGQGGAMAVGLLALLEASCYWVQAFLSSSITV